MKKFFSPSLFHRPRTWVFLGILLLGLGLRFTDLTDPPLDFHPMRQLRGALIARSMYYQMLPHADPAVLYKAVEATATLEPQEPPLLERLVALTYLATGGEHLWIARIYSILFWTVGGLFFFDLARRMTSLNGALFTWAYYLLLPFAVVVSRTFQPEPFMVMWIGVTLWAAYHWGETRSWKWALATGLLSGWTVFVKITAVYYLAPALVVIVLSNWGLRRAVRDLWVWVAALLAALMPAVYYFGFIGGASSGWFAAWGLGYLHQVLQPRFYILWLKFLDHLVDLTLLGLGLIGVALLPKSKDRALVVALWAGYVLFGLTFSYPIRTHEYYSIMLIPIVALSVASWGSLGVEAMARLSRLWRYAVAIIAVLAIAYPCWLTYTGMIGVSYRDEVLGWQKMGQTLPEGKMVGLTHEYGYRLAYYGWRIVQVWPTTADFTMLAQRNDDASAGVDAASFEQLFAEKTAGMDYFLVTMMGELDAQPLLKARLYDHYPVTDGEGYVLFDLRHPLQP